MRSIEVSVLRVFYGIKNESLQNRILFLVQSTVRNERYRKSMHKIRITEGTLWMIFRKCDLHWG